MQFEIQPYQSVGAIQLDALRQTNREQFEELPEVGAMAHGQLPMDIYKAWGVYVVYDKYDRCGEVEIKGPAVVRFKGKDLLSMTWEALLAWFKTMDEEIEESEKDFISWKLGIGIYAPDKDENPEALPESITIFRKDYFSIKEGIPDPRDASSFHFQIAFVENIEVQRKAVPDLPAALKTIFVNNKEYGILIWNQLPVRFNYQDDLPDILLPLIDVVNAISNEPTGNGKMELDCSSFSTVWKIKWDEKFIKIKSHWKQVSGGYEAALNDPPVHKILFLKKDFMAEFKLLFQQCIKAVELSKIKIQSPEGKEQFIVLKQIESSIEAFGKFYQEGAHELKIPKRKKKGSSFENVPKWLQYIGVAIISVFVVAPAWYLSQDKDSVFWMWERLPRVLMYAMPFLLIVGYWIYRLGGVRRS